MNKTEKNHTPSDVRLGLNPRLRMFLALSINTTQHGVALLKSALLYAPYNAKIGCSPVYSIKLLRPEPSVFSMLF